MDHKMPQLVQNASMHDLRQQSLKRKEAEAIFSPEKWQNIQRGAF